MVAAVWPHDARVQERLLLQLLVLPLVRDLRRDAVEEEVFAN